MQAALPSCKRLQKGAETAVAIKAERALEMRKPRARRVALVVRHGDYEQIAEQISVEEEHAAKSYTELFTNRSSFRRLLICCAIQASAQMTGVSAIQYYSTIIFAKIGITGAETLRYQAVNSVIALIVQFLCILFIDRFGRRWPLILGNLGNMVTFIWGTVLLARYLPGSGAGNAGAQWGFIMSTWVYNFSFSATCGPLSWIVPAEVEECEYRDDGELCVQHHDRPSHRCCVANVGYKYYYLFIVCNLTNALFFYLFLPETAKLPLEEMNYLFTNAPWIVPGNKTSDFISHDLEHRAAELEHKTADANASHTEEVGAQGEKVGL